MNANSAERRAQYRHAREQFDDLKIEDKAIFLVEAMVSTIARGMEEAGRVLAQELGDLFQAGRPPFEEEPGEPDVPPRRTTTARKAASSRPKTPKKKPVPPKRNDTEAPE